MTSPPATKPSPDTIKNAKPANLDSLSGTESRSPSTVCGLLCKTAFLCVLVWGLISGPLGGMFAGYLSANDYSVMHTLGKYFFNNMNNFIFGVVFGLALPKLSKMINDAYHSIFT